MMIVVLQMTSEKGAGGRLGLGHLVSPVSRCSVCALVARARLPFALSGSKCPLFNICPGV
jgi:hypothetical protein